MGHKKGVLKKLVWLIVAVMLTGWIAIIGFLIYELRFNIIIAFHGAFPSAALEELNLTEEQKLQDFEFMYNAIISGVPMIEEYEEVHGVSFKDRKDDYEELVRSTTNDYEFYCVMSAIMEDIPSMHTDLVHPSGVFTLNCYNSRKQCVDS